MGVVCCEAPPKLAHEEDAEARPQLDGLSSSMARGTTPPSSAGATLPSDSPIGAKVTAKPKPTLTTDQAEDSTSSKDTITFERKKGVRISDEVSLIPLLTSSSFFRKTPKPATITSHSYGIMPSFRIVTPPSDNDGKNSQDDNLVAKSSLWWTKEERREIVQANQKASRDFKRFQPTKLRQANLVYNDIVQDCCSRTPFEEHTLDNFSDDDDDDIYDFFHNQRLRTKSTRATTTTSHRSTKKRKRSEFVTTIVDDSDLPSPALPNATIDLPTNIRGLEWGVMPDAKRYRKAHAKTVLKWQDRFRKMNERRRTRSEHKRTWDSTESSSSSSSSSSSDEETDSENNFYSKDEQAQRQQQALILGQKASISSLRSCMLARVFGKSDELAANPDKAAQLDKPRSWSPTPSLTGTESSASENATNSESEDESESDDDEASEDESESDMSDDEDDENEHSFHSLAYYTYSSKLQTANSNSISHRRMFRPRMMPPSSWR